MDSRDWCLMRSIRRKLCCFQCSAFVDSLHILSHCEHVFCISCVEEMKKSGRSPCCGNKILSKDITSTRLLTNLAQTFGDFLNGAEHCCSAKDAVSRHTTKDDGQKGESRLSQSVENELIVPLCEVDTKVSHGYLNANETELSAANEIEMPQHRGTTISKVKVICKSVSNNSKPQASDGGTNTFFDSDWNGSQIPQASITQSSDHEKSEQRGSINEDTQETLNKSDIQYIHGECETIPPKPDSCILTAAMTDIPSYPAESLSFTQQNAYIKLQKEINTSKAAIEKLLTDQISQTLPTLETLSTPLGSLGSATMQQNTANSVEAEILQSKNTLRMLLENSNNNSNEHPKISNTGTSHEQIFEWQYMGLPVVAEFSNLSNLLLFEESCKKGWIRCTNNSIDMDQVPKIFISEAVVEEHDGVLLVRRTLQYMKCLLLGFQIVDFTWLKDSVATGRMLNPIDYEIQGTDQDHTYRSPQKMLAYVTRFHKPMPLLSAYQFFILNDGSLSKVKASDIEDLICLAGGTMKAPQHSENSGKPTVVLSLRLKRKRPRESEISAVDVTGAVFSVSWLFDFICDLQEPTNLREYVICDLAP